MEGGRLNLFKPNIYMTKKKKIAIIASTLLAGASLTTASVFAFFIESKDTNTNSIAGNVDISISNLDISNKQNFNPGDENPETQLPTGHRNGTEHKLTYTVTNDGNKSVATRSVIDITVSTPNNTPMDPSVFNLYQTKDGKTTAIKIENAKDDSIRNGVILGQRLYVLNDGTVVKDKPTDISTIKSLRYIVLGPNLNGVGEAAEIETNAVSNEANVSYAVALDYETGNEYQGCPVTFDVSVQAIQYRNTNAGDWSTIYTDHINSSIN